MIAYDFSKAFDKMDHSLLLEKLSNFKSIRRQFCEWLCSYLTNRKQRVRVNNSYSNMIDITSGIPQGSILSPLLFSLFLSDLAVLNPGKAHMIKYADDTTLLFAIDNTNDLILLKEEMNHIAMWTTTNKMEINDTKSKLLYFTKRNTYTCILPTEIFSIKAVTTLKILGVTFQKNLNFEEHFKLIVRRASQRLYFLRILKNNLPTEKIWMVFNGLIRSILEYAAPLFISLPRTVCKQIESIQKRAHKIVCGINCNCILVTLEKRRIDLAMRLFDSIYKHQHPLSKYGLPKPKKRFQMPIIRTNVRRDSFFIKCAIIKDNIHIN